MMDSGGLILAFNQAAEHTFDFSRDEVLGRELTETMHWSGWPAGLRRAWRPQSSRRSAVSCGCRATGACPAGPWSSARRCGSGTKAWTTASRARRRHAARDCMRRSPCRCCARTRPSG
jgi:PAS domain-containing protein